MKTLTEKLVYIQGRLKAPKNQRNNFGNYNYRNQEDILEAVKPLLQETGLTLTVKDEVKELGSIIYTDAVATLSDGEKQEYGQGQAGIDVSKKGMDMAQSFGSSSSYARKYALNGLFLIDDNKDADAKERLTKKHPKFQQVVQAMKGGYTLRDIEQKYVVPNDIREQLTNLS
jgi:hypothetical protein